MRHIGLTAALAVSALILLPTVAWEASVTKNLAITVTSSGGGGLPPGVTLSPIDGETMTGNVMSHNYYARNGFTDAASSTFNAAYNNGGWDDPRFFPIGQDYSFYPSNSTATFKTLGLNYSHRITSDTTMSTLAAAGIWSLDGNSPFGAETMGWHLDEPSSWNTVVNWAQGIGSGLSGRALHVALTANQFIYGPVSGTPGGSNQTFMSSTIGSTGRHVDLVSDDMYWFAGSTNSTGTCALTYLGGIMYGGSTSGACGNQYLTADQAARGDHYGDMVDLMRAWTTTFPAPNLGPYIETEDGLVTDSGHREILPQEFNWAAWSTIVHGARGLLYFGTTSNFGSGSTFGFNTGTLPGATVSMYNQAIATNTSVKNLAPVLNSPFALGYASVTPAGYVFPTLNQSLTNGIDMMTKWYNGGFYIFTTVRGSESQSNISATFTLNGSPSKTIPVVGESRNVTSNSSGVFTDTFANAYTVHVYGPIPYP